MPYPILGTPKPQFFDSSGSPLASGTLSVLDPADDTNKASYPTYDDAVAATNANTNPLTLDSRGEPSSGLWGLDGEDYKLVLKDSGGTTVWTQDDVRVPIILPYLQTAAEAAAGVTPTAYQYPPGDVRRYGMTGDGTTDNKAAFDNAVSANPAIYVPDGDYRFDSAPTAITKDFTITAERGANFWYYSTGNFLTLGQSSYLSNLSTGYNRIRIENLEIEDKGGSAGVLIDIIGTRTVLLKNIRTLAGATSLQSESSFAGTVVDSCRFQNATSDAVILNERNNFFTIKSTSITGATGRGIVFDTSGNELKSVRITADIEGCAGGIDIRGNTGNVEIFNSWFESNTSYNIRVYNTSGEPNKYNINIHNCQITGSGVDVLIGNDTGGALINGVVVSNNEFAGSNLTFISGDKVFNGFEYGNALNSGSTITHPNCPISTTERGTHGVQALYRSTPDAPYGTPAAGFQGDIRYDSNFLWVKNANGWHAAQIGQINNTTVATPLPTGSTPSVAGLRVVRTANTGSTTITSFSDGYPAQELIIIGNDSGNTTVSDATNIFLAGSANFTLGDKDVIHLVCLDATNWVEVSRSDN